ncbi:hypothetical protein N7493_011635 [Penicillium malachiteum]|uniref:Uncharacterized protein n=1 Tax=Penicillium malachiteum TaxID=1324776 RepID=A0AAD6HB23_9EURO|nr:hypothetical protein N7493_011635 [Penicillium malachiteum]
MAQILTFADSSIVMAEQSSRDVVDQTLSGGEPSPSDVPTSTTDKISAGGDVGETKHIAATSKTEISSDRNSNDVTRDTLGSQSERPGGDKGTGGSSMANIAGKMEETHHLSLAQDVPKQGIGLVASRALELNGLASGSDAGDDTASQGGSESDTSRTDSRHHTRTGSVKKPTTFKPVSFTKFAVPKAPGASVPPKAPEKVPSTSTTPLGTPQPSSRPRLVAKTTGGMRDSISKTGAGGAKAGGSGPDPNQVWNKNRPVQPTPPKHLTDEELKQQYGIHMTSRIQEDGGNTEAKWADIDDDEDDWAPETIEWTDGTKVTLTHTEPVPVPEPSSQPPKEPQQPGQTGASLDPVRIAAPKPTTSVGPNPTVLRLGANAERQAKAASISSKGANDRLPSGSTSPAPLPAKSPWATLPPVDRVSPVNPSLPPPPPAPQNRMHGNYPHREDSQIAPIPPQEIAADDFNRTWRESTSGAPRELFNSRSGRYEPVHETRRGSWRQDQGPRPPAVLQRPSHGEQSGPAEPSAAFQTHRQSHQEGMGWNRRRTSSSVSGGSGSFARRTSFGRDVPHPRYVEGRRGSQAINDFVESSSSREPGHFREHSPHRQHGGPGWHVPPSVSVGSESSPVENQAMAPTVPEVPAEDPVALQERIMKEKLLEARQRRLEEEEKEKQAREERIRQKLAALGPPPDKKRKDSLDGHKSQTTVLNTSPTATISSPPKPPVPEPTGEPKQYGMMKVHHPDTVRKLVAANERERAAEKQSEKSSLHFRRPVSPHNNIAARDARDAHSSSSSHKPPSPKTLPSSYNPQSPNSRPPSYKPQSPETHTSSYQPHSPDSHQQDAKVDDQGGQWRGNLNVSNSYAPWSTGPNLTANPAAVNNLWKPLSSDRTLGNGIFDQGLGGFPPRELPLRSQLGLDQPTMAPAPPFSAPQETAPQALPSPETRLPAYDPLSPIARPGPIGPPSSHNQQWQTQDPASVGVGVAAWKSFGPIARQREAEAGERFRQEFNETQRLRQDIPASQEQTQVKPTFNHTWKKVEVANGARGGGRRVVGEGQNLDHKPPIQQAVEPVVESSSTQSGSLHPWQQIRVGENGARHQGVPQQTTPVVPPPTNPLNPLNGLETPADGLAFTENQGRPIANIPIRSSRFFPNATEQPRRLAFEHQDAQRSPSPPPPKKCITLFTRMVLPIVKLPPKAVAAQPVQQPTFASMAAAAPRRVTPAPKSEPINWQEKFNNLMGKKPVPERNVVLAVASASKEPLDVQLSATAVSVSLPNTIEVSVQTGDGDLAARQVAEEEEIFEDREPGSQPGVRVPNMAPPAAWHAADAPVPSQARHKHLKLMQICSIEPFKVGQGDRDNHGNLRVTVHLPGQEAGKVFHHHRKHGQNSRNRRPSNPSRPPRKTHKPRDAATGSGSQSHWNKKSSTSHQTGASASSSRHQSRNASWGPRNNNNSQ